MANLDWKSIICVADLKLYVYFWRENLDATYIGIIFYSGSEEWLRTLDLFFIYDVIDARCYEVLQSARMRSVLLHNNSYILFHKALSAPSIHARALKDFVTSILLWVPWETIRPFHAFISCARNTQSKSVCQNRSFFCCPPDAFELIEKRWHKKYDLL